MLVNIHIWYILWNPSARLQKTKYTILKHFIQFDIENELTLNAGTESLKLGRLSTGILPFGGYGLFGSSSPPTLGPISGTSSPLFGPMSSRNPSSMPGWFSGVFGMLSSLGSSSSISGSNYLWSMNPKYVLKRKSKTYGL